VAKANLVLPDGTKVNIEGTADEVAVLMTKFSSSEPSSTGSTTKKRKTKKKRTKNTSSGGGANKKQEGPTSLVTELVEEGFFKAKRTIGDIQKKLEERGHIYAQTSISPALTRLTRKRTIRRIKEKKGWVYVK
jgi:hypothetical protein